MTLPLDQQVMDTVYIPGLGICVLLTIALFGPPDSNPVCRKNRKTNHKKDLSELKPHSTFLVPQADLYTSLSK